MPTNVQNTKFIIIAAAAPVGCMCGNDAVDWAGMSTIVPRVGPCSAADSHGHVWIIGANYLDDSLTHGPDVKIVAITCLQCRHISYTFTTRGKPLTQDCSIHGLGGV